MGECFVQCQTSLADSPELRVKSAVKQLAVPISRDVSPGSPKMWNAELQATASPAQLQSGRQKSAASSYRIKV